MMLVRSKPKLLKLRRFAHGEWWIFIWEPKRTTELLRRMGDMASDRGVAWTWYDTARASEVARKMSRGAKGGE